MRLTYLSIDSLAEGIGMSQVLAYVEKLSRRGVEIDLHTFEKTQPTDPLIDRVRAAGISWHVHDFGRFGALGGLGRVVRARKAIAGAELVHARSDLAAAAALLGRTPRWIWDFRSFYVDQKIELGELSRDSIQEKALRRIAASAAERASAIITLAHAALPVMAALFGRQVLEKSHVITTCVDLSRFPLAALPPVRPIRFLLAGTVNAFYDTSLMENLIRASQNRRPTYFRVASPTPIRWPGLSALADDTIQARPMQMADIIADAHVGLCVCRSDAGISLAGSMPTKIGEFLACGRPLIVNRGLGDAAELVEAHRCGVAIGGRSDSEIRRCLEKVDDLLSDPDTPQRCRALAEEHFDLEQAIDRLVGIYMEAVRDR